MTCFSGYTMPVQMPTSATATSTPSAAGGRPPRIRADPGYSATSVSVLRVQSAQFKFGPIPIALGGDGDLTRWQNRAHRPRPPSFRIRAARPLGRTAPEPTPCSTGGSSRLGRAAPPAGRRSSCGRRSCQRLELPYLHRRHAPAGLTDLLEGTLDETAVAHVCRDHAHVPVVSRWTRSGCHRVVILHRLSPSQSMQVSAVKVSFTPATAPYRDLDEVVDGKREILGEGPVRAGDVGHSQCPTHGRSGPGWPHRGEWVIAAQRMSRPEKSLITAPFSAASPISVSCWMNCR